MSKQVWLAPNEALLLPQLNNLTLKLPGSGYPAKYGLTVAQTTAARNDYLWLAYSITIANQFQDEAKNRVQWKNKLMQGPQEPEASSVPGIGSEFAPPWCRRCSMASSRVSARW